MREMGPSFVTVAAQGFYRSRVRNCYPLPKLEIAAVFTAAISHWIAPSALPVGRPVKRALISNIE